jgi:hypothetical protein
MLSLEHPNTLIGMFPSKPLQCCAPFGLCCRRLASESRRSKIPDHRIIDGAGFGTARPNINWLRLTLQRGFVYGHELGRPR